MRKIHQRSASRESAHDRTLCGLPGVSEQGWPFQPKTASSNDEVTCLLCIRLAALRSSDEVTA